MQGDGRRGYAAVDVSTASSRAAASLAILLSIIMLEKTDILALVNGVAWSCWSCTRAGKRDVGGGTRGDTCHRLSNVTVAIFGATPVSKRFASGNYLGGLVWCT